MRQQQKLNLSGVHIENTISMAVQNKNYHRSTFFLIIIALFGAVGGIFTFLSMFQPVYHQKTLIGGLFLEFALCVCMAIITEKWRYVGLLSAGGFAVIFYFFRKPFCDGFIYIVNAVYKIMYLTDWEIFTVSKNYTEEHATTVFLLLICFPILCLLCYAVIHFQNLFLSLLATFPYVEIGFFLGIAPNHIFAIMLFAFWAAMCAVHLSNHGSYHKKEQNSFLRRNNTFFPVSSMKFMVTEKIGMIVLCVVFLLSIGIDQLLVATNYKRSEEIKKLRTDIQNSVMSIDLSDFESSFSPLGMKPRSKNDHIVVKLGQQNRQKYQNVSISDLTLSSLPSDPLYLKYVTGDVYERNTWAVLPTEAYEEADVFDYFERLDYYPADFLHENMSAIYYPFDTISLTIHNKNTVVSQSVPYGFAKNKKLSYQYDRGFSAFAEEYIIPQSQKYEWFLSLLTRYHDFHGANLQMHGRPSHEAILAEMLSSSQENINLLKFPALDKISHRSQECIEAHLLCEYGYKEFVQKHYTALPDTEAMQNVRNAYAHILDGYDPQTATVSETVALLQALRGAVSDTSTYTLSPGKTPSNQDFVEYFLLKNRKGYCMHYATAGVVLARMAGIPARYCEGYFVNCKDNPTLKRVENNGRIEYNVDVLDSNAHAWVEFYINGWGWIPFEFTYTIEEQEPTPTETEPTTQETATTVVTTTQQVSPAPVQTTTSTSTNVVTPSPTPPSQGKRMDFRWVLWSMGILLLLAGIVSIPYLAWRASETKRRNKFRQSDRNAAAICIYQYLLRLMRHCGVDTSSKKFTDLSEDGEEKCCKYLGEYHLTQAIEIAAKAKFSHHTISAEELRLLLQITRKLARAIYEEAKPLERIKLRYFKHLC